MAKQSLNLNQADAPIVKHGSKRPPNVLEAIAFVIQLGAFQRPPERRFNAA